MQIGTHISRSPRGAFLRSPISRGRYGKLKSAPPEHYIKNIFNSAVYGEKTAYDNDSVLITYGHYVNVWQTFLSFSSLFGASPTTITFLDDYYFSQVEVYFYFFKYNNIQHRTCSLSAELNVGESCTLQAPDSDGSYYALVTPVYQYRYFSSEGGSITGDTAQRIRRYQPYSGTDINGFLRTGTEVVAVPDPGYEFYQWVGISDYDGKNSVPERTDFVNLSPSIVLPSPLRSPIGDRDIIATFRKT